MSERQEKTGSPSGLLLVAGSEHFAGTRAAGLWAREEIAERVQELPLDGVVLTSGDHAVDLHARHVATRLRRRWVEYRWDGVRGASVPPERRWIATNPDRRDQAKAILDAVRTAKGRGWSVAVLLLHARGQYVVSLYTITDAIQTSELVYEEVEWPTTELARSQPRRFVQGGPLPDLPRIPSIWDRQAGKK